VTVPPRPRVASDRASARPGGVPALVVATAAVMAATGYLIAPATSLAPTTAALLLAALAVLALIGLPSVSITSTATFTMLTSGVTVAALGVRPTTWSGALAVLAWIVAAVAVLVVVTHLRGAVGPPGNPLPAAADRPSWAGLAGRVALVSALAVAVAGLVLPVADNVQPSSRAGSRPRIPGADDATALASNETLDMTRRPRLSDRIVMRVRSDHATFWRIDSFDVWDGRRWTRSQDGFRFVDDGRLVAAPHDLGAAGGQVVRQTFTVVTPVTLALPAAPVATEVDAPARVYQREDGSMVLDTVLGEDSRYTVESHRTTATDDALAATTGPTPDEVLSRFAAPPVATERVRAAAEQAIAGATTRIEQVRAIERWMGERTEYSIDAPLAPTGVDVVDHFLFESRRGWCEQVASAFVVLARAVGLPARLATGYVPAERDPLTGEFVVRERHAHAWAEVWFPEVGWVPFDPTADVPAAGEDSVRDWTSWLATWWPRLVVAAVGLGALSFVAVRWWRRSRRDRRRSPSPAGRLEARLEAVGAGAGRARAPAESATAYGDALADHLGAADLATVGAVVDRALYADAPPDAVDVERAEAVLAAAEAGPPP